MKKTNIRRKRKAPKKVISLILLLVCAAALVFAVYYWFSMHKSSLLRPVPLGLSLNLPVREDERISKIRSELESKKIDTEVIRVDPDLGIVVKLEDNGEIYLSEENYPAELASLQVILKKLTMEGKRFKHLDLRYERPIIVL